MISCSFVYQIMSYKYVIYHIILFIEKSYLEIKKSKNTKKRELLTNKTDKS